MKKYSWLDGTPQNWDMQRKPHGGGSDSSTTTTASIAPEFKPLVDLYTKQATKIGETPWQSYEGQRYADLNNTQNMGIGMVQDRALNGSQTFDNAEGNLNQMMAGTRNPASAQLGSIANGANNPYLDAMVRKSQGSVLSAAATAGNRSGSFGNSGIQEQALNQMAEQANNMYGNQYQFDQGQRMNALGQMSQNHQFDQGQRMQAVGMAPQFAEQQYKDAGQLLNAGNIQQNQNQQNLDFGYQQFKEGSDYPFKQLSATGQVANSGIGQTSTTSGGGK